MNVDNLCQICREKSAPYKCPKCQLRYCSSSCYRDPFHDRCAKKFDEKEFFDSLPLDEDKNEPRTTSNDFVRTRIEEILKRKIDEKEFHNEEDDEHMEDFFEQMLPTKDSEEMYREVSEFDGLGKMNVFFSSSRNPLMMKVKVAKRKVKNVFSVMKNLYLIFRMISMNPKKMSINCGVI